MESKLVAGLKTETHPIYVGQSKNIRSRFMQHLNFEKCHNHRLLINLMVQSKSKLIEFHFIKAPQNKLDELEREIIFKLNPKHNVLMNGGQHV